MADDEKKDGEDGKSGADDKKDSQQDKGGGEDTAGLKSALEAERKAKREAEAARKAADAELETLRKEKKEREEADLSEKEKAEKRATEAEQRAQAAESRSRDQAARYQVAIEGGKLNIVDPDTAYLLITSKPNAITFDDSGNPTNVADLLKDLVKDKPFLVKAETKTEERTTTPGIPTTPKGDGKGLTDEQIAGARKAHSAVVRSTF